MCSDERHIEQAETAGNIQGTSTTYLYPFVVSGDAVGMSLLRCRSSNLLTWGHQPVRN